LFISVRAARLIIPLSPAGEISGRVVSEPQLRDYGQTFLMNLSPPGRGTILVYGPELPQTEYSQKISVYGKMREYKNKAELPRYSAKTIRLADSPIEFSVLGKILEWKKILLAELARNLPRDSAALAAGITLGVRNDFDKNLTEAMRASGTTHLVALSGYNIGILIMVFASLFRRIFSRRNAFFATIFIIFVFVVATGAAASVLRAGAMGSFILLAEQIGRRYNPERALVFAALVLTLFDPTAPRQDLGFVLSFVSFAGIFYLFPVWQRWLGWHKLDRLSGWQEGLLTTLAAQSAVLPLLLAFFGGFSLSAVLTNVLVIWATPLTMFLGFATMFFGTVSHYLGNVLSWLLNIFLSYQLGIIRLGGAWQIPFDPVRVFGGLSAWLIGAAFIYFAWRERLTKKSQSNHV